MRVVDLIEKKRDNVELSTEEIEAFVAAAVKGDVPEYQISALFMAIYFRGMNAREVTAFTRAMLYSGDTMKLSVLAQDYKVDKHSTGGVGDKVSLSLAPMVAACGPVIPMISGRGLGHTGGTLDKLEAIPGYRVDLSETEIEDAVRKAGYVITGQTASLVPADKMFYALRDVTGTVPALALIAGSIMSKKLAVGVNGLVLDVKTGSGAFMKDPDDARALARTMLDIGQGMGCDVRACITSMDQPLGVAVGNANELIESIEMLKGRGPADYSEICYSLGTEMLSIAKKLTPEAARKALEEAVESGRALEQMRLNIAAQGGDARVVDDYSLLTIAKHTKVVTAKETGYVSAYECERVGKAASVLGGGRAKVGDALDHSVGISVLRKIGDHVTKGDALFEIQYKDAEKCAQAEALLDVALSISQDKVKPLELILDVLR